MNSRFTANVLYLVLFAAADSNGQVTQQCLPDIPIVQLMAGIDNTHADGGFVVSDPFPIRRHDLFAEIEFWGARFLDPAVADIGPDPWYKIEAEDEGGFILSSPLHDIPDFRPSSFVYYVSSPEWGELSGYARFARRPSNGFPCREFLPPVLRIPSNLADREVRGFSWDDRTPQFPRELTTRLEVSVWIAQTLQVPSTTGVLFEAVGLQERAVIVQVLRPTSENTETVLAESVGSIEFSKAYFVWSNEAKVEQGGESGFFLTQTPPDGKFFVEVSAEGLGTRRAAVELRHNRMHTINVVLAPTDDTVVLLNRELPHMAVPIEGLQLLSNCQILHGWRPWFSGREANDPNSDELHDSADTVRLLMQSGN